MHQATQLLRLGRSGTSCLAARKLAQAHRDLAAAPSPHSNASAGATPAAAHGDSVQLQRERQESGSHAGTPYSSSAEPKALTPRQRRLAQQRRKWEEAKEKAAPPKRAAQAPASPAPLERTSGEAASNARQQGSRRTDQPSAGQRRRPPPPPPTVAVPAAADGSEEQKRRPPGLGGSSATSPTVAAAAGAADAGAATATPPSLTPRLFPDLLAPDNPGSEQLWRRQLEQLTGAELAALAKLWAQQLVDSGLQLDRQEHSTRLYGNRTVPPPRQQQQQQHATARARLQHLAAAAEAALLSDALSRQGLADVTWAVAHWDRRLASRVFEAAMGVPFRVVPAFMPHLCLEDFTSEVRLQRDRIYLDDGSNAVEESRLTGWQSDIGATFRYSGKEMLPQEGGMSPTVAKVRDELEQLTGVRYDSVLINYYGDGKCGMRFHADPLYGRWTPNTAVVSLGDTRTFIFREAKDYSVRWQYPVRNGDVVVMYGDCQDRLQHCIRVERRAEDAGPRMSLVFKERIKQPDGQHLRDGDDDS